MKDLGFQCICRIDLAGLVYKKVQLIDLTLIVCLHPAHSYCQFSDSAQLVEVLSHETGKKREIFHTGVFKCS
jgi:hypothetical protein